MSEVHVTITVASASSSGDAQALAEGLLSSTSRDISRWVRRGMADDEK